MLIAQKKQLVIFALILTNKNIKLILLTKSDINLEVSDIINLAQ